MKTIFVLSVVLLAAFTGDAQKAPDDCSWPSTSKSRTAVKLRGATAGNSYTKLNEGRPITVEEWFRFTCGLDATVPEKLPDAAPLAGSETVRVTLRGYLLGARFERDDDHDIHVELAATPEWNSDHMVLEMSAGAEYCKARRQVWNLLRRDGCQSDSCILRKPVAVLVTGYVLVGNPPKGAAKDFCNLKMARGMKKENGESQVRGLWRLQPVFSVVEMKRHHLRKTSRI
jgi:hypothetical protein